MVEQTNYNLKRRRRREGKTNYKKRLALIKSKKERLVVRISNSNVIAQIIKYKPEGDLNIVNTSSVELRKYGWTGHGGNAPAAYLTAFLCGTKAIKKGIKEVIFDIGLHTPVKGSNVFAALKGAVDSGLEIKHDKKIFPTEDKIKGKIIGEFTKKKIDVDSVIEKIKKEVKVA